MISSRETLAIQAYYNLLHSKGADADIMATRDAVMAELAPLLRDQANDSVTYRAAVDQCLNEKEPQRWPEILTIIREFYPFWRGDDKAVMQYADTIGFELQALGWQPAVIDLQSVLPGIMQEKFSSKELWPLNGYIQALKTIHTLEMEIEIRVRMAKLMLIRLREAPPAQRNAYRITADATLPLFNLKHTRTLFLNAVREFYYFWSNHPDAEHLLKHITAPEIL